MEFLLLGPLTVRHEGAVVAVPPGKQRAVLAALLLRAGRVVRVEELAEALWGARPPPSARVTVQNYVMRLRKALPAAGTPLISTRPGGYLITADDAVELDVTRFEGLLAAARAAARDGSWAAAAGQARAALLLWRGEPLADAGSVALAQREAPRLAELRLRALETRIGADLRLGRDGEVIAELRALAADHPLREQLHALLMHALYRDSRQAEALAAYQQARTVLVGELGAEPGPQLRRLHQQILAADPALLTPPAPAGAEPPAGLPAGAGSPYRGLAAFAEQDAAWFFGREAATAQVLDRLSRALAGAGLLVVSGASGAGKSSLLQAGVLPALRGTGLAAEPGAAKWPCVVFTPGRAPLDELAVRAAALARTDAAAIRRELAADPQRFALTARQAALAPPPGPAAGPGDLVPDRRPPGQQRLLVIVDQFEQLFTQCPGEQQRLAFITALHAAAAPGPGHPPAALVVLGVRADFEARCAHYPQLAGPVQDRYLLTPMTGRQLRMAITEPARKAGSSVDDGLVEVLLAQAAARQPASSGAGMLPLLSHALDQAWRNRHASTLTLADYERAGGIEQAVAASAQHAYDRLTADQQAAARQVFTRLTATSSDGLDTAARATRAELTGGKNPAETADAEAVLEAFTAERLLTLTAGSVEISHEILLTAWPLLRDTWLADNRTDRIIRTRLHATAADWARHGRDPSYLYAGTLLHTAAGTAARASADPHRTPPLSQSEHDFLHASNRARQRTTRRRHAVTASLLALVTGLAATTLIALNTSQEATRQRNAAIASQLINQSETLGDTNPALAKLLSVAAWRISPSPSARYAMLTAAQLPGTAILTPHHTGPVYSVAFSLDGTAVAARYGDGQERFWNLATRQLIGHPLTSSPSIDPIHSVTFSPDGTTLATAGRGVTSPMLWNVATHHLIGSPLIGSAPVYSTAVSPDGKTLATAKGDGTVRLWNLATDQQTGSLLSSQVGPVYSVAFSPDDKTLASGNADGTVRLWNLTTHQPTGNPLPGSAGPVYSVAFSPDGKTLASGNADGTVRLWNLTIQQRASSPLASFAAQTGALHAMAFSPDGKTLAGGYTDGATRLWNLATYQAGSPLTGYARAGFSATFSPDRTTLATTSSNGSVRLWNMTTRQQIGGPLSGHAGTDRPLAFSPDGKTLATTGSADPVRLWNLATHQQIGGSLTDTRGTVAAAFSPDGRTLATAGGDGMVRLWNLATHQQIAVLLNGAAEMLTFSVAFSPDGQTLAAGQDDGTVRLWDVATRQQIGGPLTGSHIGPGDRAADAVAFSPDGTTLATSSRSTIQLWNVAYLIHNVQDLCASAGRSLTRSEWARYVPPGTAYQKICP